MTLRTNGKRKSGGKNWRKNATDNNEKENIILSKKCFNSKSLTTEKINNYIFCVKKDIV